MSSDDRTADYLGHMIDAIDRATTYMAPFNSPDGLAGNQQALDAVIPAVEILGEAANRIARTNPAFLEAHQDIPWKVMRSKLIHDYFSVDPLAVWQTVKSDLPPLRARLQALV